MEFENLVFKLVESPSADQAKVGDVLFVLAAPSELALPARYELQRGPAHVLLFRDTMPKPRVAGTEDRPIDTVTGDRIDIKNGLESETVAVSAGLPSQSNCLGSGPLHLFAPPSGASLGVSGGVFSPRLTVVLRETSVNSLISRFLEKNLWKLL